MKKTLAFCLFFYPILLNAQHKVTLLSSSNGIAVGESQNFKAQIALGQQLSGHSKANNINIYAGLFPIHPGNNTSINNILSSQDYLFDNYPNPWTQETTIPFTLSQSSIINLHLFDSKGRLIKTIVRQQHLGKGSHQVKLINGDFSPGVYIYKLQIEKKQLVKTMLKQ